MSDSLPPSDRLHDTTLEGVAKFISETATTDFERSVGNHLATVAESHDLWAENCGVMHFHADFPCDDYEKALSLGIAWLMSKVRELS